MGVFRRGATPMGAPGSPSQLVPESAYWLGFPSVIEFLSVSKWADGTSRSTGTIMVFMEAGLWKAWVNDRDACQACFLAAQTVQELLERVEEAVSTGKGDWRAQRGKGRGK